MILTLAVFGAVMSGCRNQVFDSPIAAPTETEIDRSVFIGEWSSAAGAAMEVSESIESNMLDVSLHIPGVGNHQLAVRLAESDERILASIRGDDFGDWWFIAEVEPQSDRLVIRPVDSDQLVNAIDSEILTGTIDARETSDQFVHVSSSSSELYDYFSDEDAFLRDAEYEFEFTRAQASNSQVVDNDIDATAFSVQENGQIITMLILIIVMAGVAAVAYRRATREN